MGRKVNVVLPSGRVVAVDEDVALASQLSQDTLAEEAASSAQRLNKERSSGLIEGAKASLEGAADTLSLGMYGAVRGVIDPEGARNMRIRAQERGGARLLGEATSLIVPVLGQAGRLGTAGRALGYTAPGIANRAGRAVGGLAGQAAEGAILGVGGYISSTNVTGDPLTIEAAVESATIGALLDMGFNVAANKIEGVVWGSKKKAAERRVLADKLVKGDRAKSVFEDTPPSWSEFVDLHRARKKSVADYNKQVAKEQKAYDDFWQSNAKLTAAIDAADESVASIANDVYAKQGGPFAGTPERVKYNLDPTGHAKTVEFKYERGRQKFDFDGSPEARTTIQGPGGEQIPAQGNPRLRTMIYDPDGRPVISNEILERVKEFRARISRVYQMKGGGWAMKANKWVRDPSAPPNPRGALEELRVIQADFMQWRPKASGGLKDLPPVPRTPLKEIPGDLPNSIGDFSRKHIEQIQEIANSISDPQMASALERVLKDLDLLDPNVPRSAAENLMELHRVLRDYRGIIKELDALEAQAAEKEAKRPGILKWFHRAGRYVGGRAADTGGAWGAFRRQVAGTATVKAMGAVEDAVFSAGKRTRMRGDWPNIRSQLGGNAQVARDAAMLQGAAAGFAIGGDAEDAALGAVLMSGRLSMRQRIRDLVTRFGVPVAGMSRKLGSPMAYLSTSFPSGEKDTETDPRKLAVNRINELHAAAMLAPDAAFMALQPMLGKPGDIAWKMHQHIVSSLNYLVSTLPADPGMDTKMFTSNWTPQWHEAIALAHRLEAVNDPLTAIARAIAGDSHPAATEALWAVYPAIMNELAQELSIASPNLKQLTYEQASAYSNLFRTPLTGLQQPVVVTTIQGLYMTGPQSAAPQTPGPGGGAAKKAVGRPPAIQSPVAGSSVANLVN